MRFGFLNPPDSRSFYDDAISLPILKHEQQRMQEDLDQITAQLDTFEHGCTDAQLRIRAHLTVAVNAHAFYQSLDPANRRLCNKVYFKKTILTEDHRIQTELNPVYDTILDPTNRLNADYWQRTKQLSPDLDYNQIDPAHMDEVSIGTSNIWWTSPPRTRTNRPP